MLTELANIREHWTRHREVTIQHLDMLSDDEMIWRPQPELFDGARPTSHGYFDRHAQGDPSGERAAALGQGKIPLEML